MKIIEQKNIGDCTICCYSMFTGIKYDELFKKFFNKNELIKGVSDNKLKKINKYFGIKEIKKTSNLEIPMLLIVDSKNIENTHHMIYWNGKRIFDPSTKKKYRKIPKIIYKIFQKNNYRKI